MNTETKRELDKIVRPFLEVTEGKYSTCSVMKPRDWCVTFARSEKFLQLLYKWNLKHLIVIVPKDLGIGNCNFRTYPTDNVDLLFTLFHNYVNKDCQAIVDYISPSAVINPSVVFTEGLKVAVYKGEKIRFRHTGNIVIHDDVFIDANTVVHRARLDSTIIQRNVSIGSLNNISHNTTIGEGSVITTNICIGGSTVIGKNVWIGVGAMIKNGLTICDDVVIGMGSIVIRDIDKPGIYIGNPAKFLKDYDSQKAGL